MRRAPPGGYTFGAKRNYRRQVWGSFAAAVSNPSRANAMLMPSIEGDEIDVALSRGFAERNLHIVDSNPAIVATLKRRYPEINTYGVTCGAAFVRMAKRGVLLHAANLDLTGPVGRPVALEVYAAGAAGSLVPMSRVAVTVLRGREQRYMSDAFDVLADTECAGYWRDYLAARWCSSRAMQDADVLRVMCISAALTWTGRNKGNVTEPIKAGTYRSGKLTMLYTVLEIWDRQAVLDAGASRQDALHGSINQYETALDRAEEVRAGIPARRANWLNRQGKRLTTKQRCVGEYVSHANAMVRHLTALVDWRNDESAAAAMLSMFGRSVRG